MLGRTMSYIFLVLLTVLIFIFSGIYLAKFSILIPVTLSMLIFIFGLAYIKRYYES